MTAVSMWEFRVVETDRWNWDTSPADKAEKWERWEEMNESAS